MTAPASHATPTRPAAPGGHRRGLPPGAVDPASRAGRAHDQEPVRRPGLLTWVLAAAALLSLAALIWLLGWDPDDPWRARIIGVDIALSALFALEWLWRLLRSDDKRAFLVADAWEVLAIVPLATPWVGDHTAPLVVVGVARLARAIDKGDDLYGDFITLWLIHHFSSPIVDAIKRPITVAVLDEVIDVIKTGTYAENVKAALDENHNELEAMVLELIREDQTTGKLRYLPFHDDIVRLVADTVLRILDGALEDPRTTELISDVIQNSATQLREALREKET